MSLYHAFICMFLKYLKIVFLMFGCLYFFMVLLGFQEPAGTISSSLRKSSQARSRARVDRIWNGWIPWAFAPMSLGMSWVWFWEWKAGEFWPDYKSQWYRQLKGWYLDSNPKYPKKTKKTSTKTALKKTKQKNWYQNRMGLFNRQRKGSRNSSRWNNGWGRS